MSKISQALDRMIERARHRELSRQLLFAATKRETAYIVHLILAVLFFSSFLLFGHVLVANTDLLTENYPMLLLAKRDFLHGSLGLWNPYSFSGVPSSVEANTPLFLPENWLLFLVPTTYLFLAITFVAFVKMWLIGVAAYWFYCAELANRRWALFASITYQLCGMVIWVITAYVALSVLLYYTILITILWTYQRRCALANYLVLSALAAFLLMSGDIAHSCYALLGAGILALFRAFSRRTVAAVISQLTVFTASSATAILVFCIRLLPIIATLHETGYVNDCCRPHFESSSFLIARIFDTEIFGVNYIESMPFFSNISTQFSDFHLQWVMPAYFGVAAALLALWMLFAEKFRNAAFWSAYTVAVLGVITFIEPFDTLARALFSPIYHSFSFNYLLPAGFSALAALGGMSLERNLRRNRVSGLTIELFVFSLLIITMFILVIDIRNVRPFATVGSHWAQVLVAAILALAFAGLLGSRSRPRIAKAFVWRLLWLVFFASLIAVLFIYPRNQTFLSHLKNESVELLLFSSTAILLMLLLKGKASAAWRLGILGAGPIAAICIIATVYPWTNELQRTVSHDQVLELGGLGFLRLTLGVTIFFTLIRVVEIKRISARSVYIVFLFLLLAEQVPAGKINSFLNANLLYPASTLYPTLRPLFDTQGQGLDLTDYRVNFPNTLLKLPTYNKIYGSQNEVCASINVAYGIRSYGGYTDIVPPRNLKFFNNWNRPEQPESFCIYANATNNRFLDLSGVGYSYNPKNGTIARRPDALSRMMLFTRFEVIPSKTAELQRLKAADFSPTEQVVLADNPGFPSHQSSKDGERLHFKNVTSDHLDVKVQTDNPGIVLFDDSFNMGWKATVNGRAAKIIPANYNFMAVPVPAGQSNVVLEYAPRAFFLGAIAAAIGFSMWALALVVYLFRRWHAARRSVCTP